MNKYWYSKTAALLIEILSEIDETYLKKKYEQKITLWNMNFIK